MDIVLERFLPKIGDTLSGRYVLTEELGRGGFGIVYKAQQRGIEEEVALKILLPHVLSHKGMATRFQQEIQLAKGLRHPNTIRLLDSDRTEDGIPFYVMEFLRGLSLDDVITNEGSLSPERVRRLGIQILGSLFEAHTRGIVHRDLKPKNIVICDIIGAENLAKVLDFGIAKALGNGRGGLTETDMVIGTPQYM
ncbi:MAG: serine/threonine protein kinase, partial [Myxococcales bacterium]|nr:serine/threonine protein kinase [Myxococcales bacterium]